MFDVKYLVESANKIDSRKQLELFFDDFFCEQNFLQYEIKGNPNNEEYVLVEDMFDNKIRSAYKKACDIVKRDNFCFEAFFVFYKLSNDVTLSYYFNVIFNNFNVFDDLTIYNKLVFGQIISIYIDFLRDIGNITYAIKITKMVLNKNDNNFPVNENTLTLLYAQNEIFAEFYDLYLDKGFEYIESYLRLIIVCLKYEEELKAKDVVMELLDKYPYADYLDHIWELEGITDKEALRFKKALESCYIDFASVPSFFSWFGANKEIVRKS